VCSVTLTSRIAFDPYASMNGVSSVTAFLVVHRAYSTPYNSSAHLSLASSSFFYSPYKIDLLTASAYPLVWGCATAVNGAWHPKVMT